MSADAAWLPVRALSARLRARELSPVALAETCLERLERLGPGYNAVVAVMRDRALDEAHRAERELATGRWRGPLHGVPYGAKDLLATAGGVPTTWGAAPLREQRFEHDATVVRRLEAAGAVLVAKLAMVELAGGMGYRQPNASFTGPCRNPWDPGTWSGGSSSGSAAAVSAALVPFALGSETWGSILSPAACCGVTGLRPTYGRVSRHGAMALSWTLDKLGPIARTADDCGLVLEAIAGPDAADPTTAARPFLDEGPGGPRRPLRLGVIRGVADACQPAVRENFLGALDVLRAVGTVEEVVLPDLPWEAITRTILWVEASSALESLVEQGTIARLTAPEDRIVPYAREAILARDYLKALRLRAAMAREIDRVLSGLDALVGPGRAATAPPIDQEFRSALRGTVNDPMGAIGNGAGLPAVTVPSGFDERGLPTSVQFMGRAWGENEILASARAYQARTDWHLRRPPLA